ncbi:14997_t:CDS:1, partial [Gigaspora rosea]
LRSGGFSFMDNFKFAKGSSSLVPSVGSFQLLRAEILGLVWLGILSSFEL